MPLCKISIFVIKVYYIKFAIVDIKKSINLGIISEEYQKRCNENNQFIPVTCKITLMYNK